MGKSVLTAVVLAALLFATIPASARFAYVTAARDQAGYVNAGFTYSGLASSSARFSGPQSGWASSGAGPYQGPGISGSGYSYVGNYCLYASDALPHRWGQWTFRVPDEPDKSGYYDVYYGIRYAPSSTQDMPPVWTVTNASGTDYVNSTLSSVQTANVWVKIASHLQFNGGQSYTVRCASPGLGLSGKRMNFDMVAWVFVKANTATNLVAALDHLNDIKLTWTAPDPAPANYNIQRKSGIAGTWETIVTGVTATSYTDVSKPCCPVSHYRVSCTDAAGVVSGWSAEAQAVRCSGCPPEQAYNPSPANGAAGVHTDLSDSAVSGSLSWTPGPGAETHDVYFGTNPAALVFRGNQTGTSYDPGGLLPDTDYYWRVDEKAEHLWPATGVLWHFKTAASGPPYPPAHIALTKISDLWPLPNGEADLYGFSGANAKTVSVVRSGRLWIEETNRSSAIEIALAPGAEVLFDDPSKVAVQAGDVIDVLGNPQLMPGSNRVFRTSYIRDRTIGVGTAIAPVTLAQRDIIGTSPSGATPGLTAGRGPYNGSVFVRLAGSVVGTSGMNYFYLDDRTYAPGTGIRVFVDGNVPTGQVVVSGVVGIYDSKPVIYATRIQ